MAQTTKIKRAGAFRLTDRAVRNADAEIKAYKLPDGRGLYLFVTPAGGKSWRWKYRFRSAEKVMTFGMYPDISLAEARDKHGAARKDLARGIDPMEQRKAERAAERAANEDSFQSVAEKWFEHWRVGKTLRHADTVKRRMNADILPKLGSRPINAIEAPEIVAAVKAIEERGAVDLAKRALETTGMVFRFAIAHGYAKRNPAAEIRPSDILKAPKKINFARIDARELPDLLRAIDVYRGTHVTRLAMKLMALTFVRTSELIEAKWGEFDIEARRWNLPAQRMKMGTPHIVPLSSQALEVLEALRTLSGHGEWLFPGARSIGKPMSNNTILMALERMGYKGKMTGHGFRGLASTILHEQGYAHDHIELQLAHAPRNAVSASYNHALYLAPRAEMMQDWADFLEKTQRSGKLSSLGRDSA